MVSHTSGLTIHKPRTCLIPDRQRVRCCTFVNKVLIIIYSFGKLSKQWTDGTSDIQITISNSSYPELTQSIIREITILLALCALILLNQLSRYDWPPSWQGLQWYEVTLTFIQLRPHLFLQQHLQQEWRWGQEQQLLLLSLLWKQTKNITKVSVGLVQRAKQLKLSTISEQTINHNQYNIYIYIYIYIILSNIIVGKASEKSGAMCLVGRSVVWNNLFCRRMVIFGSKLMYIWFVGRNIKKRQNWSYPQCG